MFEYGIRLKQAVHYCEYDNTLDEILVDQLDTGIQNKSAVTKLLETSTGLKLTFAEAMEIAATAMTNEANAFFWI